MHPISNPIKATGHIQILRGNLAPDGAVAKISGITLKQITGPARVFDSEEKCMEAIMADRIRANASAGDAYDLAGYGGAPASHDCAPTEGVAGGRSELSVVKLQIGP